jgi:hypothetical protein
MSMLAYATGNYSGLVLLGLFAIIIVCMLMRWNDSLVFVLLISFPRFSL